MLITPASSEAPEDAGAVAGERGAAEDEDARGGRDARERDEHVAADAERARELPAVRRRRGGVEGRSWAFVACWSLSVGDAMRGSEFFDISVEEFQQCGMSVD